MAIKYVDSAATGANNGNSWTDAYTSVQSLGSLADGDEVWLSHTHDQTLSSGTYLGNHFTQRYNVRWISVNKSSNVPTKGATLRITGGTLSLVHPAYWGIIFHLSITFSPISSFYGDIVFQNCSLIFAATGARIGGHEPRSRYIDCTFDASVGGHSTLFWQPDWVELQNCTFTGAVGTLVSIANSGCRFVEFHGCDLSAVTSVVTGGLDAATITFYDCHIPAALNLNSTQDGRARALIRTVRCRSSAPSNPVIAYRDKQSYGEAKTSTTVYRTGGATLGSVSYSLELAANSSTAGQFVSRGIDAPTARVWVEAGARTITAHLGHSGVGGTAGNGANLTDQDIIVDIVGPPVSGQTKGYTWTSLDATKTSATNLAADTGTSWVGGPTTAQKVSHTYTPAVAGWVSVRVGLSTATAARTVFVCPKVTVT